jgi:hypothetical protein
MYTTIDKAIVALIMAAIQLIIILWPNVASSVHVNQDVVAAVIAGLTPILVWAFPNLPKDA